MSDPVSGPVVPGYRLLSRLGSGGFAVVYEALQESLDRRVALKVLQTDLHRPADRQRFEREKSLLSRLGEHPHVVDVHDAGVAPDGRPYLVMRLYRRGSLQHELAELRQLPLSRVVEVTAQIASALDAAHALGVVHRDVKPDNVLVSDSGAANLGDFGIATLAERHGANTTAFFTGAHAAPEVLEANRFSIVSDVYGLASTVHTLLTGRPPFVSPRDSRDLLARLTTDPPRIGEDVASPAVADIVQWGLARDPARRPHTASSFATALAHAAATGERLPVDMLPTTRVDAVPTVPAPTLPPTAVAPAASAVAPAPADGPTVEPESTGDGTVADDGVLTVAMEPTMASEAAVAAQATVAMESAAAADATVVLDPTDAAEPTIVAEPTVVVEPTVVLEPPTEAASTGAAAATVVMAPPTAPAPTVAMASSSEGAATVAMAPPTAPADPIAQRPIEQRPIRREPVVLPSEDTRPAVPRSPAPRSPAPPVASSESVAPSRPAASQQAAALQSPAVAARPTPEQQRPAQPRPAQQRPAQQGPEQPWPAQQRSAEQPWPAQPSPAPQGPAQQRPGQPWSEQQWSGQQRPAQHPAPQQPPLQQTPSQHVPTRHSRPQHTPPQSTPPQAAAWVGSPAGQTSGPGPLFPASDPAFVTAPPTRRRRRWWPVAVGLVLVLVAAGAGIVLVRRLTTHYTLINDGSTLVVWKGGVGTGTATRLARVVSLDDIYRADRVRLTQGLRVKSIAAAELIAVRLEAERQQCATTMESPCQVRAVVQPTLTLTPLSDAGDGAVKISWAVDQRAGTTSTLLIDDEKGAQECQWTLSTDGFCVITGDWGARHTVHLTTTAAQVDTLIDPTPDGRQKVSVSRTAYALEAGDGDGDGDGD